MKTALRSHRLLAAVAGLLIGFSGVFAMAAPAQAQSTIGEAKFADTCDGTYVGFGSGLDSEWEILVDGEPFWPTAGDEQPAGGEYQTVFVPAGLGEISVDHDNGGIDWPRKHTWSEPDWCGPLPGPTHTQPTCDEPGTITIPELPGRRDIPPLTHVPTEQVLVGVAYQLDGEPVEAESIHEVEPGIHAVTLVLEVEGEAAVLKTWEITIEAPGCPGEGGGLPETGSPVVLVTSAALALLGLGTGLLLIAHRRRINFTP